MRFLSFYPMGTICNVSHVEARCIADFFRVHLTYFFLEGFYGFILDEAHRATSKAGAGHAGTDYTIHLPGKLCQRIELFCPSHRNHHAGNNGIHSSA